MALLKRKIFVLAKKEITEGTDAAPTGAANAVLTSNLTVTPLTADTVSRNLDRPTLGGDLNIHVGVHSMVEFDVEIAGSGTAATPPGYADLLLGCGFAETISTDVQYDPVSGDFDAMTLHVHHDGQKHAMVGAKGNVSIAFNVEQIPMFHFTYTGLWVDPESIADPTPVFTAYQTPLPVSNANTPTFSIHGETPNMTELSIDMGNQVEHRDVVGSESVQLHDREVSGSVSIETVAISVKNWPLLAKNNTTGALQIIHGTVAGGIVTIDAPNVQILTPEYTGDNISMTTMALSLIPSDAGDDEIKITTA